MGWQSRPVFANYRRAPSTSSIGGTSYVYDANGNLTSGAGRSYTWTLDNLPWGPANPQALNRYSYVLNNPLRYIDPTGHLGITFYPDTGFTLHLTHDEATYLWKALLGATAADIVRTILRFIEQELGVAIAGTIANLLAKASLDNAVLVAIAASLAGADWYYGYKGVDINIHPLLVPVVWLSAPHIDRQHSAYFDPIIDKVQDFPAKGMCGSRVCPAFLPHERN